ncbi:hypothetical protein [Mixta calida]|uniref:transcriptional antitermination N peptide n=1 Tax=Mixta calida TaxID=665913 RepID=UPI00290D1187|nr:hypothetical protein [Mixta calida]MDU4288369.1 hypothetical protein [Mixta calida]
MNRNQRRMAAFNAKKAAEAMNESRFEKKVARALSGCSLNVARATSAPSLREKHESTAMCLPQVALYQAGHRKVRKDATHIVK